MKKFFLGVFLISMAVFPAFAEDDFFGGLIASEEMKEQITQEEEKQSGTMQAGKLLDSKPTFLKMDNRNRVQVKETTKEEVAEIVRDPAPFGLKWLATIDEIKYLHVRLTPFVVKDMPNTYSASNLPKPISYFREVLVSFGENNSLWRIAAYGKFIKDDNRASNGVKEYQKYYDMLSKKYGNAQQFYTPAVVNVEEKVDAGDGTSSIAVRQKNMEIGADGFLQKLISGEAVLYATFENTKVGVTLALLADGNGQTYIVVDYKNLVATKIEDKEIYDAL